MRRGIQVVAVAWLTGMSAAACRSAETAPAPAQTGRQTVTGKVIDLTCYYQDKSNTEPDHHQSSGRTSFACAKACVRWEGHPAGLLTQDGRVYQVTGGLAANSNLKIAEHLGHDVTIAGDVGTLDGMMTIASDDATVAAR